MSVEARPKGWKGYQLLADGVTHKPKKCFAPAVGRRARKGVIKFDI